MRKASMGIMLTYTPGIPFLTRVKNIIRSEARFIAGIFRGRPEMMRTEWTLEPQLICKCGDAYRDDGTPECARCDHVYGEYLDSIEGEE